MKKETMKEVAGHQMGYARKSAQETIDNIRYNIGMLRQDLVKCEKRIKECPVDELLSEIKYFKSEMKGYEQRLQVERLEQLVENTVEYSSFLKLLWMIEEEEKENK